MWPAISSAPDLVQVSEEVALPNQSCFQFKGDTWIYPKANLRGKKAEEGTWGECCGQKGTRTGVNERPGGCVRLPGGGVEDPPGPPRQ